MLPGALLLLPILTATIVKAQGTPPNVPVKSGNPDKKDKNQPAKAPSDTKKTDDKDEKKRTKARKSDEPPPPAPQNQECENPKILNSIVVILPENYREFFGAEELTVRLEGGISDIPAVFKSHIAEIKKKAGKDKKGKPEDARIKICENKSDYALVFYKNVNGKEEPTAVQVRKQGDSEFGTGRVAINRKNVETTLLLEIGDHKITPPNNFKITIDKDGKPAPEIQIRLLDANRQEIVPAESQNGVYAYNLPAQEAATVEIIDNGKIVDTQPVSAEDREKGQKQISIKSSSPGFLAAAIAGSFIGFIALIIIILLIKTSLSPAAPAAPGTKNTESEEKKDIGESEIIADAAPAILPAPAESVSVDKSNEIAVSLSENVAANGDSPAPIDISSSEIIPNPLENNGIQKPPVTEVSRTTESGLNHQLDYSSREQAQKAYLQLIWGNPLHLAPVTLDISEQQEAGDYIFLDQKNSRKAPFILFTSNGHDGWIFPKPDVISNTHDSTLQSVFIDLTKDKFDRHKEILKPVKAIRESNDAGKYERWRAYKSNCLT